jgi:putative two-component system response regulator
MENRILIVDDDAMICSILERKLTEEGYSCRTANNGEEALSLFYKEGFSLIISDIKMPEMDGIELLKRVKAVNPKMMVIMITAYLEIDLAVIAMRLGAYDLILKPFDLALVIHSVSKALEKKRLEEEIEGYHKNLEKLVEERTAELRQAYRTLKKAHLDSVKVLAEAIEAKDPYTRGHSDRVKGISLKIAMQLGFSTERLESLEYGALLHDIGKIGIKDGILQKPGPLSPEERRHIQDHPLIGAKMLEGIDFFRDKIAMIRNHHEYFDGNGYPDGLIGEVIPLEARIIAVADVFDAMTSLRPYRRAIPIEDVLVELQKGKGGQFDPQIVEVFLGHKIYRS